MPALVLLDVSLRTTFELSSFTGSKDMTRAQKLKNATRDPDHAHLRGGWSSYG